MHDLFFLVDFRSRMLIKCENAEKSISNCTLRAFDVVLIVDNRGRKSIESTFVVLCTYICYSAEMNFDCKTFMKF
jgi:hypothetical protein